MSRILVLIGLVSTCYASSSTSLQAGVGRNYQQESVHVLESALSRYLNGPEEKSVLTPGEFVEWKLPMKTGQVVFAEARSDSFDPALQVVDEKGKILSSNDDRYPGDQRPLLMWRCPADGNYAIHVRSFRDKFGGQFFIRYKTYDSIDAGEQPIDKEVLAGTPFLTRIPMKAGEIKEVISEVPNDHYRSFMADQFIAPDGLPDIALSQPIQPVSVNSLLLAPVAGDYYALCTPFGFDGSGHIRARTRDLVPRKLTLTNQTAGGEAPTNLPALWEVPIKAGDMLEMSTPELNLDCHLDMTEAPDLSTYDMSKDETNPFYPKIKPPAYRQPLFARLPARARDNRVGVFSAWRDGTVWIASNGAGPANKTFNLRIRPAAAAFKEDAVNGSKLRIGNNDYWSFDANAGDVLSMSMNCSTFTPVIVIRNPDMIELRNDTYGPDQTSDEWRMVVQKPGRYLQSISAMGDGGSGEYTLNRRVIHPKEFARGNPARAEISPGEIQVWKFKVLPDSPVLIHWKSSNWSYDIAVYDESGNRTDFEHQELDPHNRFGILKVSNPQTFLIVLTGNRDKAAYSIDLGPIPGYGK